MLRNEALLRDQQQSTRIAELQTMIEQQAAANTKLQQMLHESLRVPTNVHPVEADTGVVDPKARCPINLQTAKAFSAAAPVLPPPGLWGKIYLLY